ncbi:TRAP transporter large permease subunit [Phaeobacter sp. JH20_36]|uniref:TRAP transporter large permease subunit n=1 Tax=unclassified Phaeobacter TaxID=2621772 RepID=UPI003A8B8C1E
MTSTSHDHQDAHYDPLWEEIENDDRKDPKFAATLDRLVKGVGHVVMWANVLLILAIIVQVGMRYTLDLNFPKLDELQWHLYALTTMVGVSYALSTDAHVRVDVLRAGFSFRARRVIEIVGIVVLILPFCYLMIDQGLDYFQDSYRVNERSDSPTGLPARWLLKAVIPASFVLIAMAAVARLIHDLYMLVTRADPSSDRAGLKPLMWMMVGFAIVTFTLMQLVEAPEEKLVIAMFMSFVGVLFTGIPVAWVLSGIGVLYCGIAYLGDNDMLLWTGMEATFTGLDYLTLGAVVNRVYATMSNAVLVALPMFIFMGLMLDESGVAQRLMTSMQRLFGTMRGGLAITVTAIGIILAASTGIVGASVVLLGLLSMPAMMEQKYSKTLAAGVIASSGTLGILIPPSIMLVIMADQMALSVGDLFMAALFPGLIIGGLYILYIVVISTLRADVAPLPEGAKKVDWAAIWDVFKAVLPPVALIFAVLGSIFAGLATPTEASGVGAAGATLLAIGYRKLTIAKLVEVTRNTFKTTAYIFAIFLGATCFAFVLRELGGDELITHTIEGMGLGEMGTILFILFIVFLLGFVLDWIEITLIILPLVAPIIAAMSLSVPGYGLDNPELVWFVILVAVTLQTSFLTPPVGFSLFYLKGVCPPEVTLTDIYKGVVPFILLQLTGLALVIWFPSIATWLPSVAY